MTTKKTKIECTQCAAIYSHAVRHDQKLLPRVTPAKYDLTLHLPGGGLRRKACAKHFREILDLLPKDYAVQMIITRLR